MTNLEQKVLFSWIGHADLNGMAYESTDPQLAAAVRALISEKSMMHSCGPLKSTLRQMKFDKVILLWNYPDTSLCSSFLTHLESPAEIVPVKLENPADYGAIYKLTDSLLAAKLKGVDPRKLFFLLSPGTPAMAAIWVLLGKTKYSGTFLQNYQGKVSECTIPFNLTLDVIPELMRGTERRLQEMPFHPEAGFCGFEQIAGCSAIIRETISRAYKAALYDVSILLTGESGTGKELFARAIWQASRRKDRPFEAINCAALPPNLLEAELFGYKKGAFTGADRNRDGAFKRLNGGTLFLDEVGECSPELQAKLLRVLLPPTEKPMTCREFFPVGAEKPESSDVRIIAATNRDLRKMISEERFRSDLFFRLSAITVNLPSLRERREDIVPIAESLLARANAEFRRGNPMHEDKIFCENTIKFIQDREWQGNIRELFNAILQGIVMSSGKIIKISDLGCAPEPESIGQSPQLSLDEAVEQLKIQRIKEALKHSSGNKSKAAKLLGMSSYQRLDSMLKTLKIGDFTE